MIPYPVPRREGSRPRMVLLPPPRIERVGSSTGVGVRLLPPRRSCICLNCWGVMPKRGEDGRTGNENQIRSVQYAVFFGSSNAPARSTEYCTVNTKNCSVPPTGTGRRVRCRGIVRTRRRGSGSVVGMGLGRLWRRIRVLWCLRRWGGVLVTRYRGRIVLRLG